MSFATAESSQIANQRKILDNLRPELQNNKSEVVSALQVVFSSAGFIKCKPDPTWLAGLGDIGVSESRADDRDTPNSKVLSMWTLLGV